ncbi:MAG: hypothetical protein ACOWWO_19320 [Peptococcaceae bacterium]
MEYLTLAVPVVAVLGGLFIAVIAILTDHKQKMFMIEKGIAENNYSSPGLRSGLTFSFLGGALIFVFRNLAGLLGIPWYAPGAILIALGIAQLIFYLINRKDMREFKGITAAKNAKNISG